MASRDFGLLRYDFKRVDGKGEAFHAFQTPSSYVRAVRHDELNPFETGALMAYYAVRAAGILGDMGVDVSHCKSDLDKALKLFDSYQFHEVPLDDDGNELEREGDGGEPDPTSPNPPLSLT